GQLRVLEQEPVGEALVREDVRPRLSPRRISNSRDRPGWVTALEPSAAVGHDDSHHHTGECQPCAPEDEVDPRSPAQLRWRPDSVKGGRKDGGAKQGEPDDVPDRQEPENPGAE